MRLSGKSALITGAATGPGAGIARRFAAEGARLLLADLSADKAARLAEDLGGEALPLRADVSDALSVAAMVRAGIEAFGRIDILVNTAGAAPAPAPLDEIAEPEFDRIAAGNLKGLYYMMRETVPQMRKAGGGIILNIAATAGLPAAPRQTWHNAAMGWIVAASKSAAAELAPAGIRVNCLCPVAGDTPPAADLPGADSAGMRAKLKLPTPADIGNAAVFLCSDEAAMVTGVALDVGAGHGI